MTRPLSNLNLALNRANYASLFGIPVTPDSIPDLSWWIDPDDAATLTYDVGSELLYVADKVTGTAATRLEQEAVPTPRPGLFTRTENGRVWMEGDSATSRCLRVADPTEAAVIFGSGELTVFVVAKREFTSTATQFALLQKGGTNFYQAIMRQDTDGDGAIRHAIDGSVTAEIISSTGVVDNLERFISRMRRDNTAAELSAAVTGTATGSPVSTSSVGSIDDATLELFVGCAPSGTSTQYHWDGLIGEILFYQRALTAVEISQVEAYLINKWLDLNELLLENGNFLLAESGEPILVEVS